MIDASVDKNMLFDQMFEEDGIINMDVTMCFDENVRMAVFFW